MVPPSNGRRSSVAMAACTARPSRTYLQRSPHQYNCQRNASLLTAVQDLFASYHEELGVINTALLDMTREWEPELENSQD